MERLDGILVVDDEQIIRELLVEMLAAEDYQVFAAGDSTEALQHLRDHPEIIVIFSDIMMPEMDGISLIREARRLRPTIIPIVMTGYATIETARAAVQEGAYDYVLKPFSLSEVTMAVRNAIERYRLVNENARLREITSLLNISESIASIRNEKALLDFVLWAALDHVQADRGSLMITTPDRRALRVAASVGIPEEARGAVVEMGHGISGTVAERCEPLLVGSIADDPALASLTRLGMEGSFVSVPLGRKGSGEENGLARSGTPAGCLAVLNVSGKKGGGKFSEGDLKILSIVANHAAAAISNVRLIRSLEEAHLSTLQSMARLLEAKDPYTHGHSQRVRNYSVRLARKVDMSAEEIDTLHLGALLHDIGKVGVADSVLNKVDPLTSEEWDMIRLHPVTGYEILRPVQFLTPDHLALVRSHHERLDGTGYPDGLSGDELTPLVRIIAIADAYDAMSSRRAYRAPMPRDAIIGEIERGAGSQFDADYARAFIELVRTGTIDETE